MLKTEMPASTSIQVVIAALNEEQGIGQTITEMIETLDDPQVLVVDGKSTDKTIEIAKKLHVKIALQDGLGKGNALAKAFEHLNPAAKYIVITDADYTYPAKPIPEMIKILEEDPSVGMVCGNRFGRKTRSEALDGMFYFGNRLLALIQNFLNGTTLKDPLTGLRVVRSEILKKWKVKSKGFDVEVELNHQVERLGFSIKEIEIQYRQRLGEKKLKPKHGIEILKRIILETTH